MDNINSIITELLSLIDKKRQLFDTIMEVTLEQKKVIEENEAHTIGELVAKKQGVINSIEEIDRLFSDKFDMLKKNLKIDSLEKADYIKYPLLKTLKLKVEDIMSLAQKIMEIEKTNSEKLLVIFEGLKKELKKLSVGKRSIRAYETPVINNDGIYIDKKK